MAATSSLGTAMQPLDHLSLHLFIVVCEAGERAFMAPSAVSKRISDIEARFGTALFKRSKRGVRSNFTDATDENRVIAGYSFEF
jgi:hypothetical protein